MLDLTNQYGIHELVLKKVSLEAGKGEWYDEKVNETVSDVEIE